MQRTGDRESWIAFFLAGVKATAEGVVATFHRISKMFTADRATVTQHGRRVGSALRVHEALKARPIVSLPEVCHRTELSFPAAAAAMPLLVELGIAREITGRRRARLYAYGQYVAMLNEDTEAA